VKIYVSHNTKIIESIKINFFFKKSEIKMAKYHCVFIGIIWIVAFLCLGNTAFAITGTTASDVLIGSLGISPNYIDGLGGSDIIIGLSDDMDVISGGSGNDVIVSSKSMGGIIEGGFGRDLIINRSGNDDIYGDGGDDIIFSSEGGNAYIEGNDGSDLIFTTFSIPEGPIGGTIRGGNGDDIIMGSLFGAYQVTCNEGDDIVIVDNYLLKNLPSESSNITGNEGIDGVALIGGFAGFSNPAPPHNSFSYLPIASGIGRLYFGDGICDGGPANPCPYINLYDFEYLIIANFYYIPIP
jgi:hypothetical protein